MADAAYEERYCAFVDILGFTDLIGDIKAGKVQFDAIRNLLQQIHSPRNSQVVGVGDTDFQAQSISDAITLSTRLTISGLSVLVDTIERLSLDALHEGYLTRGALCRGLLYHDKQMVFGEALISAYKLETRVAKYPRIMLTKQVFDDAMASNLKHYFVDHIRQAEDGPYFVHVFRYLQDQLEILKKQSEDLFQPDSPAFRYMMIRETIQHKFNNSVDNPAHFEKLQWLAHYWNVTFGEDHPDFKWITGPGLFQKRFLST
jgi:hypothetical protein